MADIEIHFSAQGFGKARKKLQAMRTRASDARPAWDTLLTWWVARNVTHFRNRGKRWKTPWAPLADSTLAEKLRLGFPPDPLVRTGTLRRSLTERPLGIERLRPHDMEAGSSVGYAAFHQGGTQRMPARPLINARQVRDEGVATTALINWIVDGRKSTRSKKVER